MVNWRIVITGKHEQWECVVSAPTESDALAKFMRRRSTQAVFRGQPLLISVRQFKR